MCFQKLLCTGYLTKRDIESCLCKIIWNATVKKKSENVVRSPHSRGGCAHCLHLWNSRTVGGEVRKMCPEPPSSPPSTTQHLHCWVTNEWNLNFGWTLNTTHKQMVFPSEARGFVLGVFCPHYQPPAAQGWLRFYQLFMIMCFPTNRNDGLFSSHCSGMRNWYRWVSFPLGNCFSGVVTMWRWKTISKALNRCCNYLTHTGILECDAPSVISLEEREGQDPLQTHEGCIQTNNALYREWTGPWLTIVEYAQILKPTFKQHSWKMTGTETV